MKSFYFFRHGQTDWNKERRCQGQSDIALNEQGRQQARSLKDFVEKSSIEILYSSDLSRAYETAEIVSAGEIEIIKTKDLRETNLGQAEGLFITQAREMISDEVWWSFNRHDPESLKLSFPGGESRSQVLDRFLSVSAQAFDSCYNHIGMSTHGGAMRNFLHAFLPEHTPAIAIDNCIVYKLDIKNLEHLHSFKGDVSRIYPSFQQF